MTTPAIRFLPLAAPFHRITCCLLTDESPYAESRSPALRTHAHRITRDLLAQRLNLAPHDITFTTNATGKRLCPSAAAAGLDFSLAYAGPHALIAFGEACTLGIDIERIVPAEPTWRLLETVLAADELQQWLKLPAGIPRRQAFTAVWTIKEAALKAHGVGLQQSPHSIRITVTPDGHAAPVFDDPAWCCQRLTIDADHVACLVVRQS